MNHKIAKQLHLMLFFIFAIAPSRMSVLRFINITTPIEISLRRETPANLAFQVLMSEDAAIGLKSDIKNVAVRTLVIESEIKRTRALANPVAQIFSKKIVLDEIKIEKSIAQLEAPTTLNLSAQYNFSSQNSSSDSGAREIRASRLGEQHSMQPQDDDDGIGYTPEPIQRLASAVYAEPGFKAKVESRNEQRESKRQRAQRISQEEVGAATTVASNSSDMSVSSAGLLDEGLTSDRDQSIMIQGHLEITGGLAITNSHHIEIRRLSEGVAQEVGRVDLVQGIYSIKAKEANGQLVGRLIDQNSKVLGEGTVRLAGLVYSSKRPDAYLLGPTLKLGPKTNAMGRIEHIYDFENSIATHKVTGSKVSYLFGSEETNPTPSGSFEFDGVSRSTHTIVRAAADNFYQSTALVSVDQTNHIPMFPKTYIAGLNELVSSQQKISIDNRNATVVWGRVLMDQRPVAGMTVKIESSPETKAIYFNEMMLPDLNLKATSANGLYAFLNVEEGFQALAAFRGDEYFSHVNTLVESDAISIADLVSSTKTEAATIRVFDAFSGTPKSAHLEIQSQAEPVDVDSSGTALATLPKVPRLSLLSCQAENEYVNANYFYDDMDSYIHVPLVRQNWLIEMGNASGNVMNKSAGIVVGFVVDSEFEVSLAGEKISRNSLLYFDYQGRPVQQGLPGGGFILFNVESTTHEVLVTNRTDNRISRVVPVDPSAVSVIRFIFDETKVR